jgi:hypothetical protein
MLYIHKLSDFGVKPAEIESVQIIRDIKQNMRFPPKREDIEVYLSRYTVAWQEIAQMQDSLALIPLAVKAAEALLARNDPLHEQTNIQRTLQILHSIPGLLNANICYAREMLDWQDTFINDLTAVLPLIPCLSTIDERKIADRQINALFEKILRSKEFSFSHQDIVHEGVVQSVEGLKEGLAKGYLFHVTLEEELKKTHFDEMKHRIPKQNLDESEQMLEMTAEVAKGVKAAYEVNMRMANSAVTLYSFIKWAQGTQ